MDLLFAIGKRIQKLREKRGMTQDELEEKTEISAKYISAVECGQKNITIKTLDKIARGLDVRLYELFLFSEGLEPKDTCKKAIESLIIEADIKTLNLCLDFLKKALG